MAMMRSLILGLALLAACPRVADAGPVLTPFTYNIGGGFRMTPGFAEFSFSLQFGGFVDGVATVTSGPLLHATSVPGSSPTPDSVYTFGAGVFHVDISWLDEHGVTRAGTFNAAMPAFTFRVEYENADPPCDDCPMNPLETYFFIGPGSFDKATAARLGVARQTIGGQMPFLLENFTGAPGSTERTAGINFVGNVSIAVPEPSLLSVLSVGALGILRSRRRRCRAERLPTTGRGVRIGLV